MRIVPVMFTLLLVGLVAPQAARAAELSQESSIDQILDALRDVGTGLKDFTASVKLTEMDDITGDSSIRSGPVWYQSPQAGQARLRVLLPGKQVGDRIFKDDKIEYLLENGWLWDRDYKRQIQVKRQVLRPGQKLNLLKLGEGPFPLPIGQDKADVLRLFDVKKVAAAQDDPAGTVHVQLVPKADNQQFARKFKSIDVWVDLKTHFPRRIDTLDAAGNTRRTTDLTDVKLNSGLADAAFAMEKIDETQWKLSEEPFKE